MRTAASPMHAAPALPAAILAVAGVVVGRMTGIGDNVFVWIAVSLGVMALAAAVFVRRVPVVLAVLALLGGLATGRSSRPVDPPEMVLYRPGTVTCRVAEVRQTRQTVRVVADVISWTPRDSTEAIPAVFKAIVTVADDEPGIRPGMILAIEGKPGDVKLQGDIPYQIEYQRYDALRGMTARMYVFGVDVTIVRDEATWLEHAADKIHRAWTDAIVTAGFDEATTCFMLAVLGGDTLLLDEGFEEEFRQMGLAHVLAISGMHVGMVMAILLVVLLPLKYPRRVRRWYFFAVAAAVWLFAVAAGLSPSVCRSALMCTVYLGARAVEIHSNPYQGISVAVLAICLIKPGWLFEPGFQLSVCAVLALVTFVPPLDFVPRNRPFVRAVWLAAIVPVVAVIGTAPLTAFYFHSLTPGFWLPNVLVSTLSLPVMVVAGFVGAVASLMGMQCGVAVWVGDTAYHIIVRIVSYLSDGITPGPMSVFITTATAASLIGLVALAGVALRSRGRLRRAAMVSLVFGVAVLAVRPTLMAEPLPRTEIYIPRHTRGTDVIAVHDGRGYVWTGPQDGRNRDAADIAGQIYADFYRSRGVKGAPVRISEGYDSAGVCCRNGVLDVNGYRIGRIDSKEAVKVIGRVNIAVITERYKGRIDSVAPEIRADSIFVAKSVHYKRAGRLEHELSKAGVSWRRLNKRGFVWRSQR